MGSAQSNSARDVLIAKARSDQIDSQIAHDRLVAMSEVKILCLGGAESGKSALLKQMKLISQCGYSLEERNSYKEAIFSNIIQSMRSILEAMPELNLSLAPQNDARRAVIMSSLSLQAEIDTLPPNIAEAILGLWKDPSVQEAAHRSNEFQLDDSAVYYLNSIDRIAMPDYLPSDQDILKSRVRAGVAEMTFKVGETTCKIFDVDGQRSERRKWIHCFENITALIFVVGLDEYDESLYEDKSVNCLQDSLALFDSICNSQWFAKTSIILLLNKVDLFAKKLKNSPLSLYFPDYKGGNDSDAARKYLLHQFRSLNKNADCRMIYTHYTYSTDSQLLRDVLNSLEDIALRSNRRMRVS